MVLVAASLASGPLEAVGRADAAPDCTVTVILVNTCRPWLGAAAGTYPDLASDRQSQIAGHEARIGRAVDVAHLYHGVGARPLNAVDRYYIRRANTIALMNWKPTDHWRDGDGSNASVNAEIDAAADDIKSLGTTKVLLTLFHEPEDDVSGGADGCTTYKGSAGTPAEYRGMWRNVRQRFADRGVTNAVFVMNYMGAAQWDCMVDDLWPGDDLVDWVMWDPYSESTPWSQTIGRFYRFLEASTDATHNFASKPWGLGEWGVWRGASQEFTYQYYDDARASIAANEFPRLKLYSIFDHGATAPGTARIGYDARDVWDPTEVEHYRALANDPVFLGSAAPGVGSPDPAPAPPSSDPSVPTAPTDLTAVEVSATGVTLHWQPATDDTEIVAYIIHRDGVVLGATFAGEMYEDLTVQPSTAYTYSLMALDDTGNVGPSAADLVVVTPAMTDLQPPTAPMGLRATTTPGGVRLTWFGSIDDVGVQGYAVYDGAAWVGATPATSLVVAGLMSGSTHMFTVRALDASANLSGPSNIAAARAG